MLSPLRTLSPMTMIICLADMKTSIGIPRQSEIEKSECIFYGKIFCNNWLFYFDWMPFEFFNNCRSTLRATAADSINNEWYFDNNNRPFYLNYFIKTLRLIQKILLRLLLRTPLMEISCSFNS